MSRVLELLLADARTPSGGYAHSGGLEAFVDAGGSGCAGSVRGFMSARLRTVGRVEASFAAAACRCASVDELLSLDVELAARSPAAPLRQASRRLGRGLLRTGAAWFPVDGLIAEYRSASVLSPRPVALGVVARAGGVDALGAARASLYDDAATVAAAAVKLLPLDAAEATGWVLALGEEIEALATAAVAPELPSTATPMLDLRAISHATSERRLFAS